MRVAAGIFAIGFLVFTLMLKVAVPISLGEFRVDRDAPQDTLEGLFKEPDAPSRYALEPPAGA